MRDILNDIVDEIIEKIERLKSSNAQTKYSQWLCYISDLKTIQRYVLDNAEQYNLDGDIEKKFSIFD